MVKLNKLSVLKKKLLQLSCDEDRETFRNKLLTIDKDILELNVGIPENQRLIADDVDKIKQCFEDLNNALASDGVQGSNPSNKTLEEHLMIFRGLLADIVLKMKLDSTKTLDYNDIGDLSHRQDLSEDWNKLSEVIQDSPIKKYSLEVLNLCFYLQNHKLSEYRHIDLDFFEMIRIIFKEIKKFEESAIVGIKKNEEAKKKWLTLKETLESHFDNKPFCAEDDFAKFILCLLNVVDQQKNPLKEYVSGFQKGVMKRKRCTEDISVATVNLLLDIFTFDVKFSTQAIRMKILKTPIKDIRIYDHDVMYVFSKYDEESFSSMPSIDTNYALEPPEEKEIIHTFRLKNANKFIELTSVVLEPNMYEKEFLCIVSLLSFFDIILDIFVGCNFYKNDQQLYFVITICLLISTGVANIIANEYLYVKYNSLNKYESKCFNNVFARGLLSFLQISSFLKIYTATNLHYKRRNRIKKNEYFELLIDNIVYGHPEYIEDSTTRSNFIEMYFETMPQTILQAYIALRSTSIGVLQILSICTGTMVMMKCILAFVALHVRKKIMQFFTECTKENITLLSRELSYFGFYLILNILLFSTLRWDYFFYWKGIRLVASFGFTDNKIKNKDKQILKIRCLDIDIDWLNYWTFFNYWTVFESICTFAYLFYLKKTDYLDPNISRTYFGILLTLASICFSLWFLLLVFKNKFIHPYNIIYVPWHFMNSRFYPIQAKELKPANNNNQNRMNLDYLYI